LWGFLNLKRRKGGIILFDKKKKKEKILTGKVVLAISRELESTDLYIELSSKKDSRIIERTIIGTHAGLAAEKLLIDKKISFPLRDKNASFKSGLRLSSITIHK